jgi:hypothetical protein
MKNKEQEQEAMKKKCNMNLQQPYQCHKAYVTHSKWVTTMPQ